jgi:hypothetical protein
VISCRLIPLLAESGHEVIATTRSEQKHPEPARSAGSPYRSLPGASWVLLAAGGPVERRARLRRIVLTIV